MKISSMVPVIFTVHLHHGVPGRRREILIKTGGYHNPYHVEHLDFTKEHSDTRIDINGQFIIIVTDVPTRSFRRP